MTFESGPLNSRMSKHLGDAFLLPMRSLRQGDSVEEGQVRSRYLLFVLLNALCTIASASGHFEVVVLGASGGLQDGNLSAFMLRSQGSQAAVMCDVGSLAGGMAIADARGAFDDIAVPADSGYTRVGYVLNHQIKGYLVSHAHLDHVAGLVVGSPDDERKKIYALPSVHQEMLANYFNWRAWPNFTNQGQRPLNKYTLVNLPEGKSLPLDETQLSVTAWPLSHGGVESTAFYVQDRIRNGLLCLGDTGADRVEKAGNLENVWRAVADDVRAGRLKAMIIESSYESARPEKLLFGHLTPKLLTEELKKLEALAGPGSLKGLQVIVSHIKFSIKAGESTQTVILRELHEMNTLGVRFIIPSQGDRYSF